MPTDPARLRAIAAVSGVEAIAYARKDQKVERAAPDAAARHARQLPGLPVIVSAFDKAALEELRGWLTAAKATVGRVDAVLLSITAVVPGERLDELAGLDTVLYVELSRPGGVGHGTAWRSWAWTTSGPAASASRFSGGAGDAGDPRHRLHGGRRRGGDAQDLNKFGCGRNFTSDAAGVWNDQHGHGTHVLATISGTGTAQARFRGAATGLGGSGRRASAPRRSGTPAATGARRRN